MEEKSAHSCYYIILKLLLYNSVEHAQVVILQLEICFRGIKMQEENFKFEFSKKFTQLFVYKFSNESKLLNLYTIMHKDTKIIN
jgi:hypothetical protein